MAVPKRKVSKARRDKRRSSVWEAYRPHADKVRSAANTNFPTRYAAIAATTRARKSSKRKRNQLPRKRRGSLSFSFLFFAAERGGHMAVKITGADRGPLQSRRGLRRRHAAVHRRQRDQRYAGL